MPFPRRRFAALVVVCALAGCKSRPEARCVMRSPDTGVIAMPEDTPENRERAVALMHSHFPEGYEIVCEGEEAVLAPPPPSHAAAFDDPMWAHRRRMHDPVAAAAWTEPGFQRQVEDLPGTPQSMRGYAQPRAPSVGVRIGDPPQRVGGVIRSEWRITYRRRGSTSADAGGGPGPQSLFPEYQPACGVVPRAEGGTP